MVYSRRVSTAYNLLRQRRWIFTGWPKINLRGKRIMEKELTDRAEHIHKRILQLRDSL